MQHKASQANNINHLDSIEIDTIGEIMNISMGAAATAVSILLQRQVDITTPTVNMIKTVDFEYKQLEPASGIEIEYLEGLNGSNFMIMSKQDIKAIVSLLIGDDPSGSQDELDEIHTSALGEIMNQMMGASSTALATFFDTSINISTPKPFELDEFHNRLRCTDCDEYIVTISFHLHIEDLLDSQFFSVMSVPFTKALVKKAMNFGSDESLLGTADIDEVNAGKVYEDLIGSLNQNQKPYIPQESTPPVKDRQPAAMNPSPVSEPPKKPSLSQPPARMINVQPVKYASFDDDDHAAEDLNQVNLSLVMGVELSVTVEIGRTKKQVKEILDLKQGSIIELDRQAGEPVDVIVNGQLLARGDVVVIDDNFGVRITEIVSSKTKSN
ncbi:MAG: flagellar motor switch phosphatase FliY [Eubacteriales bacterium]